MSGHEIPASVSEVAASRRGWLILAVIVLFGFFVRVPTLCNLSCNPDLAGILYSGKGICSGLLPYADSVETKPPLAYFLAAFVSLFGGDFFGMQVLALFWQAGTCLLIFFFCRNIWNFRTGLLAAFFYQAASTAEQINGLCPNYTFWALPMMVGAIYAAALAMKGKNYKLSFLAGILAGLAVQTRLQMVFPGIMIGLVYLIDLRNPRPKSWREIAGYVLGVFAGVLPVLLVYLIAGKIGYLLAAFLPGRVADYAVENEVVLVADYLPRVMARLVFTFWPVIVLFGIGIYMLVRRIGVQWKLKEPSVAMLVLGWALTSIFGVLFLKGLFAQPKFASHYFLLAVPSVVIIATLGVEFVLNKLEQRTCQLLAIFIVVGLTFFVFRQGWIEGAVGVGRLIKTGRVDKVLVDTRGWTRLDSLALRPVAKNLQKTLSPGEVIYVWDYIPEVYVHSGTRAPGRHYKYWEVTTDDPWGHYFDAKHPAVIEARRELMADLHKKIPRYIVAFRYGEDHPQAFKTQKIEMFPELKQFVQDNYEVRENASSEWNMLIVYQRKSGSATAK